MRSLRSRMIFSHILPLLLILPAIGIGLIYLVRTQILLTNLSAQMTQQAQLVAAAAGDYFEIWYDPGRAEAFVQNIGPLLMAHITLIDSTGHVLVTNDPSQTNQVGSQVSLPVFTNDDEMHVEYSKAHPDEIKTVIVPVVPHFPGVRGFIGFIQLANPLISIDEGFQRLRTLTIGVIGGGLIVGIVLGLFFAITLERPLFRTTKAVYALSRGEETTPVAEQGPEEVRMLVRAFNSLLAKLHHLEVSRRQLLANLVHELGRPLGALQSATQALLGGADEDPGLRKELLGGMIDELERLRHLLDDLARLHDQVLGTLELSFQRVDITEWLPRVLAPWREAAQDKQQTWDVHIANDLPEIEIDPDRMAQALGNLISNAVRYTQIGGKITIEAHIVDSQVCFCVADNGPGFSPEDQARLFTPFFRGRTARRFSDGMGLGLYIARDLVKAHGAELTIESQPGSGSRFCILLPIREKERQQERVEHPVRQQND